VSSSVPPILKIKPIPKLACGGEICCSSEMMRDRYEDTKVCEQKRKIQGENAKHATSVERRKIRRRPLRIQKNAGDEKTGKHEEQIDSAPPHVK
jgi:hypothetical protein